VLFDGNSGEAASTATNFFGMGVNASTLRYQASATTNFHRFYCGSTLAASIGSSSTTLPGSLCQQPAP
jgi:hypothetical protein